VDLPDPWGRSRRVTNVMFLADIMLLKTKQETPNRFDVYWKTGLWWKSRSKPVSTKPRLPMGSFGKDLRMERMSRGIALEEISSITKISQRHLVALEEERFRLLPGGILSKGIVRGYVGALGLDQQDWTDRFMSACDDAGLPVNDERAWTAFASNVGKARILRREEMELRMRWIGAVLLVLIVISAAYLAVRYYGVRAGWWSSLLPLQHAHATIHAVTSSAHSLLTRVLLWIGARQPAG